MDCINRASWIVFRLDRKPRTVTGFIQARRNIQRLQSEAIVDAVLYVIQAPSHVNVNEIYILILSLKIV
jgi:NADP-dependent 3-hydroxy acid dehydrogenase YdfG